MLILIFIGIVTFINWFLYFAYNCSVVWIIQLSKKSRVNRKENQIELKKIKYLGLKHYRKGKYNKALIAFQQELNIEPKDSITWSNLGAVYNKLGSYSKAIDALEQSILYEDAEDPYTRNHLGYAYIKQRRFEEAIKILKEALEIESQYDHALYNLADIYSKIGSYDKALESIDQCLKLNPTLKKAKKLKENLKRKENSFQI